MNEQYTIGDLGDLINYRLQRAQETLDEADYNAKGEYYNAAVNRLYYACYYAASALMVANHLEASSHKGIKSMLGLKFIKTGRLDLRYGRIYQQLFENRQSGDYEDFVYCDKELYDILRPQAEEFVITVSYMI
ncbi:MAG: HEPN domain-containing protein [Muribaculaceae bacterium]|nr:HEPN domain-containing protein [Muribaculaceae bacterium]